jgi:16S rRNA (guanine966-N2)-methyltransferase
MRVISGKFKGRNLVSFQAPHIRPTTDRVKESLFNKLIHEVSEAQVLDLFAGTGNLGIEALSRGATAVTFVELSAKSLSILKKNLHLLGLTGSAQVRLVKEDVLRFIKRWRGAPFDLILADPPFTEQIAHEVMEAISASALLRAGGIVVIESGQHEQIEDSYPPYILLDRRSFGDKLLSFFVLSESDSDGGRGDS